MSYWCPLCCLSYLLQWDVILLSILLSLIHFTTGCHTAVHSAVFDTCCNEMSYSCLFCCLWYMLQRDVILLSILLSLIHVTTGCHTAVHSAILYIMSERNVILAFILLSLIGHHGVSHRCPFYFVHRKGCQNGHHSDIHSAVLGIRHIGIAQWCLICCLWYMLQRDVIMVSIDIFHNRILHWCAFCSHICHNGMSYCCSFCCHGYMLRGMSYWCP